MNLENFLEYIHRAAYPVSKQLFEHELSVADRKQLRLVSRTTNDVTLEYPILSTLYISSHSSDLKYLEVVSKNGKLLSHVSKLWWDQSAFDSVLLLWNDSFGSTRRLLEILYGGSRVKESFLEVFKSEARNQWQNLKSNRDYKLLTIVLPFLTNIDCLKFTALPCVEGSPASREYETVQKLEEYQTMKELHPRMPLASYWEFWSNIYFPLQLDVESEFYKLIDTFQPDQAKDKVWEYLAARGLKFFHDLLPNARSKEDHNQKAGVQIFFPKLRSIILHHLPTDFISSQTGGSLYRGLEELAGGLQELDLCLMMDDRDDFRVAWYGDVKSLVHKSSKSLRRLSIQGPEQHCQSFIRILNKLLPELGVLSSLKIRIFSDTTFEEMVDFGKAIRACGSIRELELNHIRLVNHSWKDVLTQWKQSGDLSHLDKISSIGLVLPFRDRNGGTKSNTWYHTRRPEDIVDWLHGTTSLFPLMVYISEPQL